MSSLFSESLMLWLNAGSTVAEMYLVVLVLFIFGKLGEAVLLTSCCRVCLECLSSQLNIISINSPRQWSLSDPVECLGLTGLTATELSKWDVIRCKLIAESCFGEMKT